MSETVAHSFGLPLPALTFAARALGSNPDLSRRLWRRVYQDGDCWIWGGAKTGAGYGVVSVNGRGCLTHRLAWELHRGPIPEGLHLDHLCRRPSCVNPHHLEPVTHAENVRRGRAGHNTRQKTHCPQGHPYSGENLRITSKGYRACRECAKQYHRDHLTRKRKP